ncbi:hypothetical protein J6590_028901 [Homalodisca vitripennis]|nr:hypothetical protein J6590_028901 [Homalodisca vitripennis]
MSLRACAARPDHRAALSVSSICSTSEVSISVTKNIRISCYNGQRRHAHQPNVCSSASSCRPHLPFRSSYPPRPTLLHKLHTPPCANRFTSE